MTQTGWQVEALGYLLLAFAAFGAHFCALKPEVPERWLLRLVRLLKSPKRREVDLLYIEVLREA